MKNVTIIMGRSVFMTGEYDMGNAVFMAQCAEAFDNFKKGTR